MKRKQDERQATASPQLHAVDALRASEKRFRALSEHASDLICILAPNGAALYESPSYRKLLGQSLADMHQDAGIPLNVIHPDDRARVQEAFAATVQSGTIGVVESRHRLADGSWRTLESIATNHLDDPDIGGVIVTSRDITARKQAEVALRQSEELFRLAFSEVPVGMCLAAPDGRLLKVNQALCQMLGYTEQELLAQGTPILTHPDDLSQSRELIRRLLAGEMQTATLEKRYLHRDGHTVWTQYTAALLRDEAGQPLYFIYHLQDITARKQGEEARAQLAAIVEASDDAIFGKSLDGVVTTWNGGAERLYGYTAAEMIGQSVARLMPPDRPTELVELMQAVARGESIRQYEDERMRHDGTRIAVALTITPIRDQAGAVVSASVVARDITARKAAEAALRASEERQRAVYSAMSCGVLVLDSAGEVVEVNAAGREIIGLEFDTLSQRFTTNGHVAAMLHEDGSAMSPEERPSYRALNTGAPVRDVVMGFRRLDGGERWVQMDAVPLLDAAGAVQHVVVSFTDITARRQAELQLFQETERRASIIAAQQEVVAAGLEIEAVLTHITGRAQELTGADGAVVEMIEGEEMVYRAASGSAAAQVGLRLPRATSLSGLCTRTNRVLRCDDAEMDERVDREACRRVGARAMILVPLRLSGQIVGVLKVLSPRSHAFNGNDVATLQLVAGVLGAALGQATAFAALRASEERFREVERHMPIGLALVAPDGSWLRVNPALCALVGYSEDELLSRTFQDITHPDDLDADLDYVRRLLACEIATHQMEKRYIHKDGSIVWILLSVSLVRDEASAPLYFISQIQDITALKQTEEALQASHRELEHSNAALEQFAYVASHDLQEPLRTITSYLGLLRRRYHGRLDEKADDFITYAVDGATRMQALIRAILDYSRIGTRGGPSAPTDCTALVETVLAGLRSAVEDTGARVHYAGLPTVWGDQTQLGQLFQNLIGNALKFRRGVPEVTITAERQGADWLLRVRDNGIGIDPAYAEQVFEIFKRLHTREEYAGTGIGLAVCKRIVERHGGRIWVESQPGAGATFAFTLPAYTESKDIVA